MNNLFDFDVIEIKNNRKIIRDKTGNLYSMYRLDKKEYQTYQELVKSKYIKKDIYSYFDCEVYYVVFINSINKSEDKAIKNEFINKLKSV